MRQGGAYSPVPPGRHINDYLQDHTLDRLFAQLLPEEESRRLLGVAGIGRDQGRQIQAAGFTALRLYTVPLEDPGEIQRFKQVMRRAFELYGLRVNLGDFLGLYDPDPQARANPELMKERALKFGRLYGTEPWVAALTLGNESDLCLMSPGYPSLSMTEERYYRTMDGLAAAMKQEAGVRCPVILGHGKPSARSEPYLAGLRNFDGVGFNLYGDTRALQGDLDLLQRVVERRTKGGASDLAFLLNEFGQDPGWLLWAAEKSTGDERRSREFAAQIDLLDRSPLIAARFAFELTDEAWKGDPSAPGYEGSAYAAKYGILGKRAIERTFIDHREQPPEPCPAPPINRVEGPRRGPSIEGRRQRSR